MHLIPGNTSGIMLKFITPITPYVTIHNQLNLRHARLRLTHSIHQPSCDVNGPDMIEFAVLLLLHPRIKYIYQ